MPPKKVEKIKCPTCGMEKSQSEFYKSGSMMYAGLADGRIGFCKECNKKEFLKYYEITNDFEASIYATCLRYNIPFSDSEMEGALKEFEKLENKEDLTKVFMFYMKSLNSLGAFNNGNTDFDIDGIIKVRVKDNPEAQERLSSFNMDVDLTDEDKLAKKDVITLMGYDPFAGSSLFDQKFLYNELLPYLDEDTLEDMFKLSQIIQIVNNNNQIRKIDLMISRMSKDISSLLENQGSIKSLSQTKNQIVTSTDKIAKENGISVKNRGDKRAGKSTLTHMMKDLRELGFEDAEQDYYDQNKAFGMKRVADISNKSILEQLQFDENDYHDMINQQRELIQKLQEKVDDCEEEIRQLHVKLDNK